MTTIALRDAQLALASSGSTFITSLRHGTLEVELYQPDGVDLQTPHTRDELYVVATGTGEFICAEAQNPVQPGDVLFAAAGVEHRFVRFSTDFCVWVFFYGPEGGESAG